MGSDISDFQLRDEMKRKYEYQFLQVYLSEYEQGKIQFRILSIIGIHKWYTN